MPGSREKSAISAGIVISVIVFMAALMLGRYGTLSLTDAVTILAGAGRPNIARNIIMMIRLPRTLCAFFVGSSLAVSGLVYQSTFGNRLVSPDILGVSSGCCVGAGIAILLDMGTYGISLSAFVGGSVAVIAALALPRLFRNQGSTALVLSGIIVGAFMNSVISLLKYTADNSDKLSELTYWMMGSLSGAKMSEVAAIAPVMIACMAVLVVISREIDIVSLGRDEALSLGTNYAVFRLIIISCSTLLTSASVSVSGNIGWVGLVIPHISRRLAGSRAKYSILASIFYGGSFMMFADTVIRLLSADEIPAGVITGLTGAVIYSVILMKTGRNLP